MQKNKPGTNKERVFAGTNYKHRTLKTLALLSRFAIYDIQAGLQGFIPPLGLMYLSSHLKQGGFDVDVIDADTDNLNNKDILKLIVRNRYTHIGISVFTRTRSVSYQIAREIRLQNPDIYISLGGPHCCVYPEMPKGVDSVISGEAEHVITSVFSKRQKGIIYAPTPTNLDGLLYPDRTQFDTEKYGYMVGMKVSKKVTSMSTSRGCPYRCSFCTRIKTMEKYRVRSPKNVIKEIMAIEELGFNSIMLVDDNFNAIPRRALEIAELIKKEGIRIDFGFQGRAYPNEHFWNVLASAGFNQCFMGIEHIKPEIVHFFNKYPQPGQWKNIVSRTLRMLQNNDICTGGSIILGAPMETRKDAVELIDFCYREL